MKVWGSIFNFFALILLMYLMMIGKDIIGANERQFEEIRLRYAVDYATGAAFSSAVESDNIGVTYEDLQGVKLNPNEVLDSFKSIMCLNYDMSLSEANFSMLDRYISFATLITNNGYYIASLQELDTTDDKVNGGEYGMVWSLKKPYVLDYGTKSVAVALYDESWVLAKENGTGVVLSRGASFSDLALSEGIVLERGKITDFVNQRLSDDINNTIRTRNEVYREYDGNTFVHIPVTKDSVTGVNAIEKPTFLIGIQGVDFAGPEKLSVTSVGGYKVTRKYRVLAFRENGQKYFCYETQIPDSAMDSVEDFYDTMEEAALEGYLPHLEYLSKPLKTK